jgi:hypothetical protein
VKSPAPWRRDARESVRSNYLHSRSSNSRSTGQFLVGPLEQGQYYAAPRYNVTSEQKCECNTVMFRYMANLHAHPDQPLIVELCSLYMACTVCQNVSLGLTWALWMQDCDEVYVTQYPVAIPRNTAVPNWAYLNYTVRARYRRLGVKSIVSYSESCLG